MPPVNLSPPNLQDQQGRCDPDGLSSLGKMRLNVGNVNLQPLTPDGGHNEFEERFYEAELARTEAEERENQLRRDDEELRRQIELANHIGAGANRWGGGGDPDDPDDSPDDDGGNNNRGHDHNNRGGGLRGNHRDNNGREGGARPDQQYPPKEAPALNPTADWYATLPPPWNQVPTPESKADDLTKTITNGSFTKFDGTVLKYLPWWRSGFIAAAHCKNITEQAKQQYMATSLDQNKSSLLATLSNSTLYSNDGYRTAIHLIEQTFGGPEQSKRRYEAQLENVPFLNPTKLSSMQDWLARVLNIDGACREANPSINDPSPFVLPMLLTKVPHDFQIQSEMWREMLARPSTLGTLIDYIQMLSDRSKCIKGR